MSGHPRLCLLHKESHGAAPLHWVTFVAPPPDCLACRRSVYRTLSLPQRDGQVLGTDLNRSESKRRSSEPDGLEHAAGETTAPEEALTATFEACDSSRCHVGQPFIEWCTSSSATVVNRLVATRGRPRVKCRRILGRARRRRHAYQVTISGAECLVPARC